MTDNQVAKLILCVTLIALTASSSLFVSPWALAATDKTLARTGTRDAAPSRTRTPNSSLTLLSSSPSASNPIGILDVSTSESVTLPGAASGSPISIAITVPSGPLADAYRKVFGVSNNSSPGTQVPIPQTSTTGENSSQFYHSMSQQQLISLGLNANFSSSAITPVTASGGFGSSLDGFATILANVTQGASFYEWQAFLGYRGPNATSNVVQSVFSDIIFAKWLLNATSSSQYQSSWITTLKLPSNATLLNTASLSGLNWNITLGGGSSLKASVSVTDCCDIDISETMVVTNQNLTATPSSLFTSLGNYKTFEIDYQLPISNRGISSGQSSSVNGDFSIDWSAGANPSFTQPSPFTIPTSTTCDSSGNCVTTGMSITVTASMSASLGIHMEWNVGTSFQDYFQINSAATLIFQASITGAISKKFSAQLFQKHITTFVFFVGIVPVWADLDLAAEVDLEPMATGSIQFTSGVIISDTFKAGAGWTSSGGWAPFATNSFSANRITPTVGAQAQASITLSFPFEVQLLVYSLAGPQIAFTPYIMASVTLANTGNPPPGTWKVDLGFKIDVGVTFEKFLKDLLGLSELGTTTIYNVVLISWTGNFVGTPQFTTNVSTSTPSVTAGASLPVQGTAKTSSGSPVANSTVTISVYGSSSNALSTVTTKTNNTGVFSTSITAPSVAGSYTVEATVTSGSFIATGSFILTVTDDTVPPVIQATLIPPANSQGWNDANVTVVWSVSDDGAISSTSGCGVTTMYKETNGTTLTCTATDGGGLSSSASVTVEIDKTPPQTSIRSGSPQFVSGTNTYVSVLTPFNLSATDNRSGVDQIEYGIDDSTTPSVYQSPFTIPTPGTHVIYYRSIDNAGNLEAEHSITVTVGATRTVVNGDVQGQYSDYGNLSATLIEMATQQPIQGKTLTFTLVSQSDSGVTDLTGTARVRLQLNGAAGMYTQTASFAGDNTFLASSATSSFTIVKEDATVNYTGDTVVTAASTDLSLRATVIEDPDNHLGDLTKASVTFTIYSSTSPQKQLNIVGPIPVVLGTAPGVGVAIVRIGNMPASNYTIVASLDPNVNQYYTALSNAPTDLTVFLATTGSANGAGLILGPSGDNEAFTFKVAFSSSGLVKGTTILTYNASGLVYTIKSNSWIGLAIYGNHAFFQSNATLTIANATSRAILFVGQGYSFRVDAYDNGGTTMNGGIDIYQITVWDANGLLYHQAGGNIRSGDVEVLTSNMARDTD